MTKILIIIALSILLAMIGLIFYWFWDYIINKEDKNTYGLLHRLEEERINNIEVVEDEI